MSNSYNKISDSDRKIIEEVKSDDFELFRDFNGQELTP